MELGELLSRKLAEQQDGSGKWNNHPGIGGAMSQVEQELRERFDGPTLLAPTPDQISTSIRKNAEKLPEVEKLSYELYPDQSKEFLTFWSEFKRVRSEWKGNAFFLCLATALACSSSNETSFVNLDPKILYLQQQRSFKDSQYDFVSNLLTAKLIQNGALSEHTVGTSEDIRTLTNAAHSVGGIVIIRQRLEFPLLGVNGDGIAQEFGHLVGIKYASCPGKLMVCGDLSPYGVLRPFGLIDADAFFANPHLDVPVVSSSQVSDTALTNTYVYYQPMSNIIRGCDSLALGVANGGMFGGRSRGMEESLRMASGDQ